MFWGYVVRKYYTYFLLEAIATDSDSEEDPLLPQVNVHLLRAQADLTALFQLNPLSSVTLIFNSLGHDHTSSILGVLLSMLRGPPRSR